MTQVQIENTLNSILVLLNSLLDQINTLASKTLLSSILSSINDSLSDISQLLTQIGELQTSIGLVNRISRLLDVNIVNIEEHDILQYDGDRWTNIKTTSMGSSNNSNSNVSKLSNLDDVRISGVIDGQSLVYNSATLKWINSTVQSSTSGGTGGITEALAVAAMWNALETEGARRIHNSHMPYNLNIEGEVTAYYTA